MARRKQLLNHLRYEVQVLNGYGWGTAGNWPARTRKEALASLKDCARGGSLHGSTKNHRVVRLKPVVVATIKANLEFDDATQRYRPLKRKGSK